VLCSGLSGGGQWRVHRIFSTAHVLLYAPCVLLRAFVSAVRAVGRQRGSPVGEQISAGQGLLP